MTSLAEFRQKLGLPSPLQRPPDPTNDEAPAGPAAGASEATTTKGDEQETTAAAAGQTHGQLAVQPAAIPAQLRPQLEGIPITLRSLKRWAPWRAQWNEKRGKWDKIPCTAAGAGLSTAKPERWLSFDAAAKAYITQPDKFAGIGLVMTGIEDLVGIDLDGCIRPGDTLEPWAEEVVKQAASYTEISPSGRGLRIFTLGDIDADWTRHDAGIEVYAGHEPRFLTVTGLALPHRDEVRAAPEGFLAWLQEQYPPPVKREAAADADMPELLDELSLPDLAGLGLNHKVANFLAEGPRDGEDRSRALFAAAVALDAAGLDQQQALSILASSPHAMEVALDHRRQDHDRALAYLWKEHVQKATGRGASKVATLDDFEDLGAPVVTSGSLPPARFNIVHAADFGKGRKPLTWLIKKILPHATVGVLYGPSGAGKSFLVMDMAVAIARGLPEWRGFRCKQGDVLYICAEGAEGAEGRLQAHADFHGYERADVPLWVLDDAPNLLLAKDVTDLAASVGARGSPNTKLIIVDTLAQVTPGANENTSEEMGKALTHCKQLARATGALVLLVAHSGKDQSKGIRGWSGIKGALDVEIAVDREDDNRQFRVSKMRNGAETDWMPFGLHTVQLGTDEDGDPIASAVVQAADATAPRKQKPRGKWQVAVMRTAESLVDLAGPVAEAQLIDAVVADTPEPEPGKRDRRRRDAMEAVDSLRRAGLLVDATGGLLEVAE